MHCAALRIAGFKSFADPVEILIGEGASGIAGPNGCGKSNIVDAMRWVMGEASSKNMRGGEMDHVIFSGADLRPAREIAEVALRIDNSSHQAPSPYSAADEIEISRRIERDMGSIYRINGRDVRARDVQLFFADMSLGAHSSAIVGQGRIDALVLAKPKERRQILEEAAGISGLHRRRHEAELRLQAAEANLSRLREGLADAGSRLRALKRQARQADAYRLLSDDIQALEALALYVRHRLRAAEHEAAAEALQKLEAERQDAQTQEARQSSEEGRAKAKLDEAAKASLEADARLARLERESDFLDRDMEDMRADLSDVSRILQETREDMARHEAAVSDARAKHGLLLKEKAEAAPKDEKDQKEDAALRQWETRRAAFEKAQTALDEAVEKKAFGEAERRLLESLLEEARRRRAWIADEKDRMEKAPDGGDDMAEKLTALRAAYGEAEEARRRMSGEFSAAEGALERLRQEEGEARQTLEEAARTAIAARAAGEAKEALFPQSGRFPAMMDDITIKPGYELSLAAALGDDLMAAREERADVPAFWREMENKDPAALLPDGATPLSSYVEAPPAMRRRLARTGLVDAKAGRALQARLQPGQRLVSKEGDLWRWDGYAASRQAAEAAERRFRDWRRLAETIAAREAAERRHDEARRAHHRAAEELAARTRSLSERREALEEAGKKTDAAREALSRAEEENLEALASARARAEKGERLAREGEEIVQKIEEAEKGLKEILAALPAEKQLDALRAEAREAQRLQAQSRQQLDEIRRARSGRETARVKMDQEIASWEARLARSEEHLALIRRRHDEAKKRRSLLEMRPDQIEARRKALAGRLEEARRVQSDRRDALALAQKKERSCAEARRQAAALLGAAREAAAAARANKESAEMREREARQEAEETSGMTMDAIFAESGLKKETPLPDQEALRQKAERLREKRDAMGAPNLRASEEASELADRQEETLREIKDLEGAVAKLRRGIARLNKEGRARLLKAFKEADGHFASLFKRLFGGGRAKMALTDSEDPLQAGLDISASPPGKKLRSLSLLSGGERALTALALLFAVFLTRPAPICILDEVDASLDERNVERFCALVREIASRGTTRFIIVTHHPMTLAEMDRLYGVTMEERGVSRLVSVDLARAESLRDKPIAAVG